jgi:hypothetical protein
MPGVQVAYYECERYLPEPVRVVGVEGVGRYAEDGGVRAVGSMTGAWLQSSK